MSARLESHLLVAASPRGTVAVFDPDLRYLGAGPIELTDLGLGPAPQEDMPRFEVLAADVVVDIEPLYRLVRAGMESDRECPTWGGAGPGRSPR